MNDQGASPALIQKVRIIRGAQSGIGRYGHGADLDRAEIGGHEFRAIRQQEKNALLWLNPKVPESAAYPIDLLSDLRIRKSSTLTEDGSLFTAPFSKVAIHKMVYQVVLLW
jgi:hypothetical protein